MGKKKNTGKTDTTHETKLEEKNAL